MAFDANTYNAQYKREKYDSMNFRVPKGKREEIAAQAAARGMSVNKYLLWLVDQDKDSDDISFVK